MYINILSNMQKLGYRFWQFAVQKMGKVFDGCSYLDVYQIMSLSNY